ncbi:MAG: roadblock/LC7 domain-containing protein [Actinomycetota bacterium]
MTPSPTPDHVLAGTVSEEARNFNWLLQAFAQKTDGVQEAIAVSSDGLLLASSVGRHRNNVEQFAAITSGLLSLANGAARCFEWNGVEQLIVEMPDGFMFVSAIGDGSALGVLADPDCDVGLIGYEMTMLLHRVGRALTPALVVELKNLLTA